MSSDPVIRLENLGKCYHVYENPRDRLLQMLTRGRKQYFREFWALRDVSLTVRKGECLGVVGRNGAGKSTLMQLVCGTLNPTNGALEVQGRVAALLELGAGFNPEFSGRENVLLSAAVTGLSQEEIEARYEDIVEFSGVRDFIEQPVKTYSSGMYVRLAFSIATSVDPDILVIDEALSVGDGEFARKSFDRIMGLREKGATVLFCSHSMYHIEAICNRAVWLERGRVAMLDEPARVVTAFSTALAATSPPVFTGAVPVTHAAKEQSIAVARGTARIERIEASADGAVGRLLAVRSGETNITIHVAFSSDPNLPPPAVAIGIHTKSGHAVTSAGTTADGVVLHRGVDGRGQVEIAYPRIPLLKGEYTISVFLTCERILHVYDYAERYIELTVSQPGLEQGVVALPHSWRDTSGGGESA